LFRKGYDKATVEKIEKLLYIAEYKRRQAAPGVKITARNFGKDRRYPIVNRYRDSGEPLPEFPQVRERLYRFEGD
jgi:NAD+ synthase